MKKAPCSWETVAHFGWAHRPVWIDVAIGTVAPQLVFDLSLVASEAGEMPSPVSSPASHLPVAAVASSASLTYRAQHQQEMRMAVSHWGSEHRHELETGVALARVVSPVLYSKGVLRLNSESQVWKQSRRKS